MQDPNQKWNFSHFDTQKKFVAVFPMGIESTAITPREETEPLAPDELLPKVLRRGYRLPLYTEQIVREALIFPVLSEVFEHFQDKITLFSGESLSVENETTPLTGTCDYIIGGRPRMSAPEIPMICVVEAKLQDFESGTYQCAAELYACKLNNEREGKPYPFYFGCVTTGDGWRFIKLDCENKLLIRDTFTYTLGNLPQLLGVWKWVLDTQLAAAP